MTLMAMTRWCTCRRSAGVRERDEASIRFREIQLSVVNQVLRRGGDASCVSGRPDKVSPEAAGGGADDHIIERFHRGRFLVVELSCSARLVVQLVVQMRFHGLPFGGSGCDQIEQWTATPKNRAARQRSRSTRGVLRGASSDAPHLAGFDMLKQARQQ
jgi:hypothetical protein